MLIALGAVAWLCAGIGEPGAAEPRRLKLLAVGDSLVHGYGLAAAEAFPAQLEAALGARGLAVAVINGGNSGDTTAGGRARLDWALSDDPDLVLVELGGNDGLRGIEPAETYRNLDDVLKRLAVKGLPVLFTGMRAPRNLGDEYVAEFDRVFPRLADKHGVTFYPFFLEGVALDPALNQSDGFHPNAAGVAVIVERIAPIVEDMVRRLRAGRGDG